MEDVIKQKITSLRNSMIANSKSRGHQSPKLSLKQFKLWITSQPRWDNIVANWVDSGFNTYLAPSVDRLNNDKSYTLNNIQLVTWVENMANNYKDSSHTIEIYNTQGSFIGVADNSFAASLVTKDTIYTISNGCRSKKRLSKNGFQYKYMGSSKVIGDLTSHENKIGKSIPVYMLSLEGDFIKRFKSFSEALKFLGLSTRRTTKIKSVCEGKTNTFQGYRWCYADEASHKKLLRTIKGGSIVQYDLKGNKLKVFSRVSDTGCKAVKEALDKPNKQRCGFQWRTLDSGIEVNEYSKNYCIELKKVYQYDKQHNFITEHKSLKSVIEKFGGRRKGYEKVLYGEKPSYKGFYWSRIKNGSTNTIKNSSTNTIKNGSTNYITGGGHKKTPYQRGV